MGGVICSREQPAHPQGSSGFLEGGGGLWGGAQQPKGLG